MAMMRLAEPIRPQGEQRARAAQIPQAATTPYPTNIAHRLADRLAQVLLEDNLGSPTASGASSRSTAMLSGTRSIQMQRSLTCH